MLVETMLQYANSHRKQVAILVTVIFLAVSGWLIYTGFQRVGKIAVEVHIVPSDATVKIDGKPVTGIFNRSTAYITPGKHTLVVEKTGYTTYTQQTTFDSDRTFIVKGLSPESSKAKEWASKNQDAYTKIEKYGAAKAIQDGKVFFKNNPIASKLPITDPYFTIGYTTNKDDTITITINTQSPRYRYFAVKKIRSLGFDPSNYRIIFPDFKNPLEVN